jgi:shikimate dehydrogenase
LASLNPEIKLRLAGRNKAALDELIAYAKNLGLRSVSKVSVNSALAGKQLVVSTLPAKALDPALAKFNRSFFSKPKSTFFDVAYEPWPSAAAELWLKNSLPVISGIEMLLWQAIAQIRIFTEGSAEVPVPNEQAVLLAMRHSIGLI